VDAAEIRRIIEYYYEQGWTDGLPVMPVTESYLEEFLAATPRDPDDVLIPLPHLNKNLTVRLAALNVALAGVRPRGDRRVGRVPAGWRGDPGRNQVRRKVSPWCGGPSGTPRPRADVLISPRTGSGSAHSPTITFQDVGEWGKVLRSGVLRRQGTGQPSGTPSLFWPCGTQGQKPPVPECHKAIRCMRECHRATKRLALRATRPEC